MAQPFYARKIDLNIGPRKGETVYSAQAYYYGTITTKQVATQIAQESALTPADVIGVIERLAYFCQTHMALGYKIKLDGLGIFYNELLTEKSVSTPKEVTAKLVKVSDRRLTPSIRSLTGRSVMRSCPRKPIW